MLNNILVGLDDSGWSRTALRHALDLADEHGARLHLATVADDLVVEADDASPPGPLGPDLVAMDELEVPETFEQPEADPVLTQARAACEERGVIAVASTLIGDRADRLLRHLAAADLLVLGRGGTRRARAQGIARSTRTIVRRATKPVLITGPEYVAPGGLLCYYDGTAAGQRALQLAAQLCLPGQHDLHVICAARSRDDRRHREDATEYLRAYKLPSEVTSITDDPCAELHRLAQLTDVSAVMVSRSRAPLWRSTLAERLLQLVKLPVWVQG